MLSVEAGLRHATAGAHTLRSDFVVGADVDLTDTGSEDGDSAGANAWPQSYVMGLEGATPVWTAVP